MASDITVDRLIQIIFGDAVFLGVPEQVVNNGRILFRRSTFCRNVPPDPLAQPFVDVSGQDGPLPVSIKPCRIHFS